MVQKMFQKKSPKNSSVHILPLARDRISPHNINTISIQYQYNIKQTSDEDEEKYRQGDY